MSEPFTSLQPDSGHVLEKIITNIGTIIAKKIRFQFPGRPLPQQGVNQTVSEVNPFFTEMKDKACTSHLE